MSDSSEKKADVVNPSLISSEWPSKVVPTVAEKPGLSFMCVGYCEKLTSTDKMGMGGGFKEKGGLV